MKKIFLTAFFLAFSSSGLTFAGGLDTLIEVARNQGEIAKSNKEETDNYGRVKRAIANGSLAKGTPKTQVRKLYGSPVVEFKDDNIGKEKWVYKDAGSSFFDGMKIYLIFDDAGNLEETKVFEKKKEKEDRK
jgi:hypothetical protein